MSGDFLAVWQAATLAECQRLLQAAFAGGYGDRAEGVVVGVAPRAPFPELLLSARGC